MIDKPLFSYSAEGSSSRGSVIPLALLIFGLGISCFFVLTIAGFISGSFLIFLGVRFCTRLINEICFYESEIHVKYFFFKKVVILSYDRIKWIRKTREPKTNLRIFVADIFEANPIKKFTWHCTDEEFDEMKHLLLNQHVRINHEE